MSLRTVIRNKRTWLFVIPILLVAVFVGGPYGYIHFIEGDAQVEDHGELVFLINFEAA